jgi:8-oxo-dGTP diphosphatase
MSDERPRVGIGVMILNGDRVLLGKRKGAHGSGEYAFPGGHLEYLESFEECARREVREECAIEIENIRFQLLANIVVWAPKHFVHIGVIADWKEGEPQVLEPEKCEGWAWYPLTALPAPLFYGATLQFEAYESGEVYKKM